MGLALLALVALDERSSFAGPRKPTPDEALRNELFDCKTDALRKFLAAGGDPNAGGESGPLLHVAANNGCVEAMRLLLDKGADIERTAPDGETALLRVVGSFYRTGIDALRFLLDRGADANHAFPKGTTPLMKVVCSVSQDTVDDYAAAVKLLLSRGADPNRKGPGGVTALSHARECGARKAQAMLRGAGAK